MSVSENIKDTKQNGILVECVLLGTGADDDPYRPEVFDKYDGYYHFDTRYMDVIGKTCKIWVNKKKTAQSEIAKIKTDPKITKIKETTAGVIQ